LINCEGGGDCDGGSHGEAYDYIKQKGIPDETFVAVFISPNQASNSPYFTLAVLLIKPSMDFLALLPARLAGLEITEETVLPSPTTEFITLMNIPLCLVLTP